MSEINPTIEDVRDKANQLFYESHGKQVNYKIIAAKLSQLADDVYNSVNKEKTFKRYKEKTEPSYLISRRVRKTRRSKAEENSLSL